MMLHDWNGFLTQPKPWIAKTSHGLMRITATITLRWWLILYLEAVMFFCVMTRREADHVKLSRIVRKGLKVKYQNTPVSESTAHE